MSNYSKTTNFSVKDTLASGDPNKVVKGVDIDTEFNNIQTYFPTKTDNASAAITGGTIDGTPIGNTTVASGKFSNLSATALDNTPIGNTTVSTGKFSTTESVSSRVTGSYSFTSGQGMEFAFASGKGHIFGYDRTAGSYLPVTFDSSNVSMPSGLDNTPIGQTTPNIGKFTSLQTTAGYAQVSEDGTRQIYVRTSFSGNLPAIQVSTNDPLVFATNSTERGRFTANGNFQVGSGADAGDKFQVFGSSYLNGRTLVNGATDNGTDALQVAGASLSTLSTAGYGVSMAISGGASIGMYAEGGLAGIYTKGSFPLYLGANGANMIGIVPAGRVLIGTTTDNGTDALQVNGYGNFQAASASAQIKFGRTGDSVGGGRIGGDSGYMFRVYDAAASANPFNVTQAGRVLVGTTTDNGADALQVNGTIATTGIKINGGTTALNAYEEGTFTPTLQGDITAGTATYNSQTGTYTRIGRLIHFKVWVNVSNFTGGAGNLIISGLPYTSKNTANTSESCSVGQFYNITFSSGYNQFSAIINPGNNVINLLQCGGGNTAPAYISVSQVGPGSNFLISGSYNV